MKKSLNSLDKRKKIQKNSVYRRTKLTINSQNLSVDDRKSKKIQTVSSIEAPRIKESIKEVITLPKDVGLIANKTETLTDGEIDLTIKAGGEEPEGVIFTNPNLYLRDDPIKAEYINLSEKINYTHVIVTRFSYRFVKDSPIGKLFDSRRMKRRFQLLEAFCFPSVVQQLNKNFYWVLIVDRELPEQYLDRLYQLIARFYESPNYTKMGPRQIFVYKWEYKYHMSSVEWIREIIPSIDDRKYLITTRLDDDDSICKNFTLMIREQLISNQIRGFFLITFESGYYWYPNDRVKFGIYKPATKPYIAIGLSLITNLQKYPFTVYFGNHTKLVHYIRNYKNHKLLKRLCDGNREPITEKNHKEKYTVVKRTGPVFIRTIHDQNLQRGMRNIFKNSKTAHNNPNMHNLGQVTKSFGLNLKKVEKVNLKI